MLDDGTYETKTIVLDDYPYKFMGDIAEEKKNKKDQSQTVRLNGEGSN